MANYVQKPAAEVAKGVFQLEIPTPFSVGPVNLYLLQGEKLTLVDAGPLTEEAWHALNAGLESIQVRLEDIEQVILTHHHVDHCGQLERLRRVSQAHTMAHPLAVPYVEMDEAFLSFHDRFFYDLYRESGVPDEKLVIIEKYHRLITTFAEKSRIDTVLKHGQKVPGLSEWTVLYTPGHSQSHLSLYRETDRVMVAGDHIIKRISSNAFIEPPRDQSQARPLTLVQYRTALQMCADMEIDLALSGHGEPVAGHRELILQRLQKNWERTDRLRELLRDGEKTAYELNALLFPTLYEQELPLTLSETLGHIDLLKILHQVECREAEGVLYYSL
ncbi:MBL fold metallo-hydrolase [Brevibacillus composti]|uniref:MBL fold metallo-hydrolase n=1 Tax=Brevibacillus composti TaxID=2796470 RepID=A0A7T5JPZ1_9BACL|nr:MBL fold metallo-hydrolase [Brevibacillus composti]QQE75571.1 MBL fold metallo-hydrolase [Brevibacillus composti]QUO42597.1 MBL fold metallo-hydrolase [Brevibacillus composti]